MEGRGGGWWPDERSEEPGGSERDDRAPDAGHDDSEAAEPPPRPPRGLASRQAPQRSASRYSMYVGLAFVALAIFALLNTLSTDEGCILGVGSCDRGEPLAEFAVPAVPGPVNADANIAQDDCESSLNPCPSEQQRDPACRIDEAGSIRVCDLFDRPLAISFWFTRGGDCLATQDDFDQVATEFEGRVNFLSINVRDDREVVEEIVRTHGWTVPVGHDRDGAVSNIYKVGGCPTIVLAYPGGIIHGAEIGNFTVGKIEGFVRDLLAASARREPGTAPSGQRR